MLNNKIRISIGSAAVLKLASIQIDTNPTTCYLMTYTSESCIGKCGFCPQGLNSDIKTGEQLSRVQWPIFSWENFYQKLVINQKSSTRFGRVCIQVLNYKGFYSDVAFIINEIHRNFPNLPISAAIPPISLDKMQELKNLGLERIGIALDACNDQLFQDIKGKNIQGPYSWKKHWEALQNTLEIFGLGFATTHFIVGLGETEKDMIESINEVISKMVLPGIFLFTPIKGTPMENFPRPSILQFRHIQIARYLLLQDISNFKRFMFDSKGNLIQIQNLFSDELGEIVNNGEAFKTAGCPDCNRPYYTASPGKEQDGYPRDLKEKEKKMIFDELAHLLMEKV